MYSKILILRFPQEVVHQPLVCDLVRDFDLTFNILNAQVLPRKEGVLTIELYGQRKNFTKGVKYLKKHGVKIVTAASEIKRKKDRCTHCGACTAVCPTGALYVNRPEMNVKFDQAKCSVCELCVPACPSRVIKVRPTDTVFFE